MAATEKADKANLSELLRNKNVLKAQLRRTSRADLVKLIDTAQEVQNDKAIQAGQAARAEAERSERIAKIQAMMDEQGLSTEELLGNTSPRRGRPRKTISKKEDV